MGPSELGSVVRMLIARWASEPTGTGSDTTGWSVLTPLADRVRGFLEDQGDVAVLDAVVASPQSMEAVARLGHAIESAARSDPFVAAGIDEEVERVQQAADGTVAAFVRRIRAEVAEVDHDRLDDEEAAEPSDDAGADTDGGWTGESVQIGEPADVEGFENPEWDT